MRGSSRNEACERAFEPLSFAWNNSLLVGFLDGERADGYYFSAVLAIPRS